MKILITTPLYPPDIGGPATYSKLLFDELPHKGVAVEVLTFGQVRYLSFLFRHIVFFFKVLKKAINVDIVFAQDPLGIGFPSALVAKLLGKKLILKVVGDRAWEEYNQQSKTLLKFPISNFQFSKKKKKFINLEDFQKEKYDFGIELRRKIQKFTVKMADKIIVPSEYLKKIVLTWGIGEEKIKVIYNSLEAIKAIDSREELRQKLRFSSTSKVLISAGRLVSWKGFDLLIQAVKDMPKEAPDIKLYIIGEGPMSEALELKVESLKLKESVFLVGKLPHEKVLQYLQAGDLFVLNTGYEGLSHQILEAMAVGIPVITTNIGGNPELINPAEGPMQVGVLVEYNNKTQLERAILNLLGDEKKRVKFAEKAKEKIKEFSKAKMIKETIRILANKI